MKKRHPNILRQIAFIAEFILVVPVGFLLSLLPWKIGYGMALLGGRVAYRMNTKGRQTAYRNLDVIYAPKPISIHQKETIVKRLFSNIATTAFEYLKIGDLTAKNYHRFARIENVEALDRALEEKKGVIAVTGHIGNWEYLGSVGAKLGKNVAAVIYRQRNPYTDRWLTHIREQKGKVTCFYNEVHGLRNIAKHLKQNGILAILADEKHSSNPVFLPFFGLRCATAAGPAKLHLRYGSPIVFLFAVRQDDGKYLLTVDGPYHYPNTGDFRKDCLNIMASINGKLEQMILRYPDQWFSLLIPKWETGKREGFRQESGVAVHGV